MHLKSGTQTTSKHQGGFFPWPAQRNGVLTPRPHLIKFRSFAGAILSRRKSQWLTGKPRSPPKPSWLSAARVFSLGPTLLSCDQATQSKERCAESICFLPKFASNSLPEQSFDGNYFNGLGRMWVSPAEPGLGSLYWDLAGRDGVGIEQKAQQQDAPEDALLLLQVCLKNPIPPLAGRAIPSKSPKTKHPRKEASLKAAVTTGLGSWWDERLPAAGKGNSQEWHTLTGPLQCPPAFIRDCWSHEPLGGLGHPEVTQDYRAQGAQRCCNSTASVPNS